MRLITKCDIEAYTGRYQLRMDHIEVAIEMLQSKINVVNLAPNILK